MLAVIRVYFGWLPDQDREELRKKNPSLEDLLQNNAETIKNVYAGSNGTYVGQHYFGL